MRTIESEILTALPFWERLSSQEKEALMERSTIREFEKGQLISSCDSSCMGMIMVLSGGIRICLLSDEGREITLYRLKAGEFCMTTASCVIRQITFDTVVTATAKSTLLVIPPQLLLKLSDENVWVRAFMFETETEHFSQAIWAIQEVLFKRFDQRLAGYLLGK